MPTLGLPRSGLAPVIVWFLVLVTIFVTEYAVMVALPAIWPAPRPRLAEAAVDAITLVAVLAPLIWGTVVRPLQEVIRLRARFLTDLFARIEAEKRRTAHELHDGVGQSLSLLVSGLRSAHATISDPEVATRCEQLLRLAQESLREVKRLALGLRPSLLDDLGLAPALERLVADVRQHHPIKVTLDASDLVEARLPEPVETAVFRIVQEAIANVVAHAGASSASVVLSRGEGAVRVSVTDDGVGISAARPVAAEAGHLGLSGMRERAALLGGSLTVESAPGRGARITAVLPVKGVRYGSDAPAAH
jgi:signal transduction histidine kinase